MTDRGAPGGGSAPVISSPGAADWRLRKHRALAILGVAWMAEGLAASTVAGDPVAVRGVGFLLGVAIGVTGVLWCTWDGRERGTGRRVGAGWIAAFAVVPVPVHLFRSRGFRGGLVACLLAFLHLVALGVLSGLAFEAGLCLRG